LLAFISHIAVVFLSSSSTEYATALLRLIIFIMFHLKENEIRLRRLITQARIEPLGLLRSPRWKDEMNISDVKECGTLKWR
jgi:hypothetical protein